MPSGYEDDALDAIEASEGRSFRNARTPDEQIASIDVDRLSSGAISIAAKEKLKQIVAKVERINEEIKEVQDQRKDVFAEAKSMGYDVKALRTVIRERTQDAQERAEQEAINDVYRLALDMND